MSIILGNTVIVLYSSMIFQFISIFFLVNSFDYMIPILSGSMYNRKPPFFPFWELLPSLKSLWNLEVNQNFNDSNFQLKPDGKLKAVLSKDSPKICHKRSLDLSSKRSIFPVPIRSRVRIDDNISVAILVVFFWPKN